MGPSRNDHRGPFVSFWHSFSKAVMRCQNSRTLRSWAGKSTCVSTLSNGMTVPRKAHGRKHVILAETCKRGDGTIEKRPPRPVRVLLAQFLEGGDALPELQNTALLGGKIDLRLHLVERHDGPSQSTWP